MNNIYRVTIHYEAPYPSTWEHSVEASNFGLAVNRAFTRFRKDKVTSKRQQYIKFDAVKVISAKERESHEK